MAEPGINMGAVITYRAVRTLMQVCREIIAGRPAIATATLDRLAAWLDSQFRTDTNTRLPPL